MLYVEPMLGGVTFTCAVWHASGERSAVEGASLATARISDTRAVTHAHRRRADRPCGRRVEADLGKLFGVLVEEVEQEQLVRVA